MKAKNTKQSAQKTRRKPNEIVPTMLRMREGLRRKLEAQAKQEGCSMNELMVSQLEAALIIGETDKRDALIVDLLVGANQPNADLLRNFVLELQKRPQWSLSEETKDELMECLSFYITRMTTYDQYNYMSFDDYKYDLTRGELEDPKP